MKKITIICSALLLFSLQSSKAQNILDKIDNATNKVDRANNTANKSKSTGDKIMGFFGKKKKDGAESSDTKTIIKITGVTFEKLKSINDNIKNSKDISGTKMKFSSSNSSITVQHAGTTDDLLKTLQKASPDVFREKNIEGLDEGEISVKIK